MNTWKIYWDNFRDAYLYGSSLVVRPDRVMIWQNRLAPPGSVLTAWYSKVNFQAYRIEPALPILCEGKMYAITLNARTEGTGGCILKISFYDRFNEPMSKILLREQKGSFRYPKGAYCYTIELINAGIDAMKFYFIQLEEVGE